MATNETEVSERAEAALKTNAEAYRLAQEAVDMRVERDAALTALRVIQRCTHDRLGEINGHCTTYKDAFRKLEIACGALVFIEQHAEDALV